MDQINNYWQTIVDMAVKYVPNLLLAAAVLIIGFWIVKKISQVVRKSLARAKFNNEITPYIISILEIGLKIMVVLSAAGIVGIETASLVAVLAAAGFAVGMALQGSLGNFAAGVIILIFKPYKVGDWVEVKDKFGKVEEIQIFNTIVATPGQKTLIIPNGQVIDDVVTNLSNKGSVRLELNVTMPYEESYPRVKEIIMDVLTQTPKVMKDPAPTVGIETYDSHNIVLAIRPFVDPDDYWEVTFDAYARIKKAFNENSIRVAYSEGVEIGSIGS